MGLSWDQGNNPHDLTNEQLQVVELIEAECSIQELMDGVGRTSRTKFRDQVLKPLLDLDIVEMTLPDKPTSPKQKYRLSHKVYLGK
ncbi:hypothetical protein CYQ88_10995 [Hydrogenovibrio sp. SC-1]|uniref:Fic family protein n=1 Tax=Hydrogenovibrio sp. SC-1 TaxID=2065820 RepID=UPI000C7CF397|nr:hypothetical protein [Hydrogenovibrio sp. SC-1]PLA73478.1 hypothetical protein CYQ88_10995 [Hydrogenovibrio sp. SC-1]